jgi:hypothetical protein
MRCGLLVGKPTPNRHGRRTYEIDPKPEVRLSNYMFEHNGLGTFRILRDLSLPTVLRDTDVLG